MKVTKREIEDLANEIIEMWGLDQKGWTFRWNKRMVRAVGKCRLRSKKHQKTIELSHKWFVDIGVDGEEITWELMEDTILHEVAHGLDYEDRGTSDHGPRWKNWALQVGADPERTCDVPRHLEKMVAKWIAKCPNCDYETVYHRKPSKKYACTACCKKHNGGKFSYDYVLDLRKNDSELAWA